MAAFKAYKEWLPNEKLPLVNSYQTLAGGLGAITATQLIHIALDFIHWRNIFYVLAATTLLFGIVSIKCRNDSLDGTIQKMVSSYEEVKIPV